MTRSEFSLMTDDYGNHVKRVKCPTCGRVVAWAFASGNVGCYMWHVRTRGARRRQWFVTPDTERVLLIEPTPDPTSRFETHVYWFRWDEPIVGALERCCGPGVAAAVCGRCHVSYDLRDVHAAVNSMVRNRRDSIKLKPRFDTL